MEEVGVVDRIPRRRIRAEAGVVAVIPAGVAEAVVRAAEPDKIADPVAVARRDRVADRAEGLGIAPRARRAIADRAGRARQGIAAALATTTAADKTRQGIAVARETITAVDKTRPAIALARATTEATKRGIAAATKVATEAIKPAIVAATRAATGAIKREIERAIRVAVARVAIRRPAIVSREALRATLLGAAPTSRHAPTARCARSTDMV